jgi:prepilin-type N-terminal cleavage/methylation domain-containing protein
MEEQDQAGFSLIEVLLSVVILGLAIVAMIGSMGTGMIASRTHRNQADASTVLVRAGERLKSNSTTPYAPCGTPASYTASVTGVTPLPSNWTSGTISIPATYVDELGVTRTGVQYWDGTGFQDTCYDNQLDSSGNVTGILRLQQVRITVTSPDGKTSQSLSFLKRG